MAAFIISLIFFAVSVLILYWIISTAIDSSNMARDIREIKEVLKNQFESNSMAVEVLNKNSPIKFTPSINGVPEECPACSAKVLSTDEVCSSCGLILILNEEDEKQ